ncbi:MAG: DUF2782 domain-containing protein [Gammaproteobacteria bacterium]
MKRLFILFAIMTFTAHAEPPPQVEQAPEPPSSLPSTAGVNDELEPEVSIIKRDDAVVTEYRMNGQLYMVKIVPVVGPPYYLMDTTGDGSLNLRRNELDPGLVVPSWMIFRW